MKIYHFIFYLSFSIMCELPIDLNQYETCSGTIDVPIMSEYLLNLNLSSDTSWEEENNESAILN